MRLAGKTAVVTGGSTQFGGTIAKAYVAEGADLYVQDWPENKDKLDALVAELKTIGPDRKIGGGTYDLNTTAGAKQFSDDGMKLLGKIDILVNTTAGGGHGKFFEMSEAAFRKTIDRGLLSYFLTSQAVGKEMARKAYGKIINISSIVGRIGSGGAVGWGANNGGIDSMTAAIAQAIGPYNINVTALARGATETTSYPTSAVDERLRRLPFGRLGKESDVVGPAIFLATDEAHWITGSVVYCDGGYVTAAATDESERVRESPYTGP